MIERLRALDHRIRIAIVGAGSMGRGLVYQSSITPGIDCVAVADVDVGRAVAAVESVKRAARIVDDLHGAHQAIREGAVAVCADGDLLARCELVDAFVESSNAIIEAGRFAVTAIEHGKHLILMNSEIDLIFGPYLLQLARQKGVTYTSCDGDQHGVIKRLIDELRLWGFRLIMAGNIKGFLDRRSNPVSIIAEADKRNLGYRMATAYTDGTKLAIEMALVANACGLSVSVPGMSGPTARDVHDVFELFDLDQIAQSGQPVVDYILGGEPGGGVFCIGHCDDPYQADMLSYYKMGRGPFYLFYRPYHLCHIEAMRCIAEAYLDGRSLLQPDCGFRTNVYARAKRPLTRGETLDGIGGFTSYGVIENDGGANHRLPICLAEDLELLRDIGQDEPITMDDVRLDPSRLDVDLFFKAREAR